MGLGHAPSDVTTLPKLINPGMPTHAPPGVDAADGRMFFGKPREQVLRETRAGGAVPSRSCSAAQRRWLTVPVRCGALQRAAIVAQLNCRQQQIVHRMDRR